MTRKMISLMAILACVPAYFLWAQTHSNSEAIHGQWTLELQSDNQVQFSIHRSWLGHNEYSSSSDFTLESFRGLSLPQIEQGGTAKFEMVRDAGSLACEGTVRNGEGGGTFTFSSNPEYVSAMSALGYGGLDSERLFELAVHDVSRAYIQELDGLGYHHLPLDQLVE